jgi:hypothetical protein
VDLTATVSAIKAERETRPVRIVAAGFLIKKAPAEADAFSEKTLGAEASLPCASTPKNRWRAGDLPFRADDKG